MSNLNKNIEISPIPQANSNNNVRTILLPPSKGNPKVLTSIQPDNSSELGTEPFADTDMDNVNKKAREYYYYHGNKRSNADSSSDLPNRSNYAQNKVANILTSNNLSQLPNLSQGLDNHHGSISNNLGSNSSGLAQSNLSNQFQNNQQENQQESKFPKEEYPGAINNHASFSPVQNNPGFTGFAGSNNIPGLNVEGGLESLDNTGNGEIENGNVGNIGNGEIGNIGNGEVGSGEVENGTVGSGEVENGTVFNPGLHPESQFPNIKSAKIGISIPGIAKSATFGWLSKLIPGATRMFSKAPMARTLPKVLAPPVQSAAAPISRAINTPLINTAARNISRPAARTFGDRITSGLGLAGVGAVGYGLYNNSQNTNNNNPYMNNIPQQTPISQPQVQSTESEQDILDSIYKPTGIYQDVYDRNLALLKKSNTGYVGLQKYSSLKATAIGAGLGGLISGVKSYAKDDKDNLLKNVIHGSAVGGITGGIGSKFYNIAQKYLGNRLLSKLNGISLDNPAQLARTQALHYEMPLDLSTLGITTGTGMLTNKLVEKSNVPEMLSDKIKSISLSPPSFHTTRRFLKSMFGNIKHSACKPAQTAYNADVDLSDVMRTKKVDSKSPPRAKTPELFNKSSNSQDLLSEYVEQVFGNTPSTQDNLAFSKISAFSRGGKGTREVPVLGGPHPDIISTHVVSELGRAKEAAGPDGDLLARYLASQQPSPLPSSIEPGLRNNPYPGEVGKPLSLHGLQGAPMEAPGNTDPMGDIISQLDNTGGFGMYPDTSMPSGPETNTDPMSGELPAGIAQAMPPGASRPYFQKPKDIPGQPSGAMPTTNKTPWGTSAYDPEHGVNAGIDLIASKDKDIQDISRKPGSNVLPDGAMRPMPGTPYAFSNPALQQIQHLQQPKPTYTPQNVPGASQPQSDVPQAVPGQNTPPGSAISDYTSPGSIMGLPSGQNLNTEIQPQQANSAPKYNFGAANSPSANIPASVSPMPGVVSAPKLQVPGNTQNTPNIPKPQAPPQATNTPPEKLPQNAANSFLADIDGARAITTGDRLPKRQSFADMAASGNLPAPPPSAPAENPAAGTVLATEDGRSRIADGNGDFTYSDAAPQVAQAPAPQAPGRFYGAIQRAKDTLDTRKQFLMRRLGKKYLSPSNRLQYEKELNMINTQGTTPYIEGLKSQQNNTAEDYLQAGHSPEAVAGWQGNNTTRNGLQVSTKQRWEQDAANRLAQEQGRPTTPNAFASYTANNAPGVKGVAAKAPTLPSGPQAPMGQPANEIQIGQKPQPNPNKPPAVTQMNPIKPPQGASTPLSANNNNPFSQKPPLGVKASGSRDVLSRIVEKYASNAKNTAKLQEKEAFGRLLAGLGSKLGPVGSRIGKIWNSKPMQPIRGAMVGEALGSGVDTAANFAGYDTGHSFGLAGAGMGFASRFPGVRGLLNRIKPGIGSQAKRIFTYAPNHTTGWGGALGYGPSALSKVQFGLGTGTMGLYIAKQMAENHGHNAAMSTANEIAQNFGYNDINHMINSPMGQALAGYNRGGIPGGVSSWWNSLWG